jgi:hypothetical protein
MDMEEKCKDFVAKLLAGKNIVANINPDDWDEEYLKKIVASLEELEQTKPENFSNTEQKERSYLEFLKFLWELGKKQGPYYFYPVKQ